MGRQYRPPRAGGSAAGVHTWSITAPAIVTSSSTAIAIPNYGATDLGAYTAGEYVLDAPSSGVMKRLFSVSSSSLARVVRFSTGTSVKNGDGTAYTQITFNATGNMCVDLMGINSTAWVITSMYPPTAANSTGIVAATS